MCIYTYIYIYIYVCTYIYSYMYILVFGHKLGHIQMHSYWICQTIQIYSHTWTTFGGVSNIFLHTEFGGGFSPEHRRRAECADTGRAFGFGRAAHGTPRQNCGARGMSHIHKFMSHVMGPVTYEWVMSRIRESCVYAATAAHGTLRVHEWIIHTWHGSFMRVIWLI